MATTAWVFPGQGSQYVGMCSDSAAMDSGARELLEHADRILGFPLSAVMFQGPEEDLRQTRNTQPAIFVHSMVLASLMGSKRPSMVAGHSLGEYSALVVSGALTFEAGLRLVRLRGELMQHAGELEPGTMAAIVGLDRAAIESICRDASRSGIVQAANFNSPGQIAVSGSIAGVRAAMAAARLRGAKMVKELVVSGAFHSPLMQSARQGLQHALEETVIADAQIPVYANVTAEPVTSAGEIRAMLLRQLTSPVRWEESVRNMVRDGASHFLEVGPGKVLQGLVRRIAPSASAAGVERYSDLQRD